jgi:hypothetical protein
MENIKILTTIEIELTQEDIDDLMVTILEGGICYWADNASVVGDYLGEYASEQISRNGTLIIHDMEDDKDLELNLEKLINGIQLYIKNSNDLSFISNGRIDNGEIDAYIADSIAQYALFNEVVYG